MCRGKWRIWTQARARGRWRILQDEEGEEYSFDEEEQAVLFCFLQEMGPRYEQWFRTNWLPRLSD